jgi:hypothetical protein
VNLAIQIRNSKYKINYYLVCTITNLFTPSFVTENQVPYINDIMFQLLSLRIKSSLIDCTLYRGNNSGETCKQIHGLVLKFRSVVSSATEGWQNRFHTVQ